MTLQPVVMGILPEGVYVPSRIEGLLRMSEAEFRERFLFPPVYMQVCLDGVTLETREAYGLALGCWYVLVGG